MNNFSALLIGKLIFGAYTLLFMQGKANGILWIRFFARDMMLF